MEEENKIVEKENPQVFELVEEVEITKEEVQKNDN